jgi:hypothetical protein
MPTTLVVPTQANRVVDTKQSFDNVVFNNFETTKQLFARCAGSGVRYGTPVEFGTASGGSGYAVSASNVFIALGIKIAETGAVTNCPYGIGVGDTDVGFSSASAPTNATYGSTSPTFFTTGTAVGVQYHSFCMRVPASKYLYVTTNDTNANTNFVIYGYEIPSTQAYIA